MSSNNPPAAALTGYQPFGGLPTINQDVPACAVLLAAFVPAAIWHIVVFIRSRIIHPPKFIFSFLLFIFCASRSAALCLRIAWATDLPNTSLALASTILIGCGVLIVYIINLIFTRRIVRALHPTLFSPSTAAKRANKSAAARLRAQHRRAARVSDTLLRLLLFTIVAVLVMVIVCSVLMFSADDVSSVQTEHTILVVAGTYVTVLAALPALAMALVALLAVARNGWRDPSRRWLPAGGPHPDVPASVGEGSFGFAMALLAFTSCILTLGSAIRIAGTYAAVPMGEERWFLSKPALYCLTFVIEVIVAWVYAVFRVDKRYTDFPSARLVSGSGSVSGSAEVADKEVA
ncbi:hypothetical protein VTJ04DRAFT_9619 [Mycothermus thermophilus]|uniref:uncharacterized protein n=1 Tax=Humicola insolens TaxID=85995 RepID=UPI0037427B33